ncbi:hypothetical protein K503DRAFT_800271 [Rhizopogon vinicolor AM-OR11-026]|uniref:WD40 repeat-like protein n=1 Tax=Rhizopogon vinicolor AM-OR11-026 TaxID=1314800 RepID=A0A1B7N1F0_9AGAM|nr:hypothetical protein K503DRAFT_800271 [Rhizopogon vinicolor AM-OR11-026]
MSFSIDGKLLATTCWDINAYAWDVSAIVGEADLANLLSSRYDGDKLDVRDRVIKSSDRV